MLKRLLLASTLSVSMIPAAVAADIEPPPSVFDWSGFYIGGHVGYGDPSFGGKVDSAEADFTGTGAIAYGKDINADGILGGLQAGYNVQMDSVVLGAEADISLTDFSGSTKDKVIDEGDDVPDKLKAEIDWLASLRARAGFAMDTLLIYATGGVAYTHPEFDFYNNGSHAGSIDIDDAWGYVVGGGVEYAVAENASVRLEGLYYGFDAKQNIKNDEFDDADEGDSVQLKDIWAVRVGVNWLFH
jgi:outer membrane immunogenic protein